MYNSVTLSGIFLVTYSILYGIMLNACLGQNLFPYGQLFSNRKARKRVFASLMLINFLPILVFASVFFLLEGMIDPPSLLDVVGVFLVSLIVFVPYRILQAYVVSNPTRLYQRSEIARIFQRIPLDRQTVQGHVFGVLMYESLALFGFLILAIG